MTLNVDAEGGAWLIQVIVTVTHSGQGASTPSIPGTITINGIPIPPETRGRLLAATLLGRFGTPADIAAMVEFLAGDDAAFIRGAEFRVDGRWPTWQFTTRTTGPYQWFRYGYIFRNRF
ncbi:SDR family oxidoreductase [Glutamicibacter protophormiae]|uniref:SDR family oxidoreductase n=1 Tax=Glutamicibacter protophormiae TaxID=37930 RepID=UPI003A8CEC78